MGAIRSGSRWGENGKVVSLVFKIVALSLLLIAWSWPFQWSPEGKIEVLSNFGYGQTDAEVTFLVRITDYDDGTRVLYLDLPENEGWRPFIIDQAPEKPCAPWLKDFGMTKPDGWTILESSEWTDSDWRLQNSDNPACLNTISV